VTLYAMTIYLIEFFPIHKIVKYIFGIVAGVFVIVTVFNPANYKVMTPVGAKLEYDSVAYTYYEIKKDFPILKLGR